VKFFPDHFIVLTSPIRLNAAGNVEFEYWSFGKTIAPMKNLPQATFEANYYGAVIAES
jgi:hypothetical protein